LDTTQRLANATPVLLQQGLTRSQSSGETFGKIDLLKAIGHARNSRAFTAAHAATRCEDRECGSKLVNFTRKLRCVAVD
jgi:hypothetical protein